MMLPMQGETGGSQAPCDLAGGSADRPAEAGEDQRLVPCGLVASQAAPDRGQ